LEALERELDEEIRLAMEEVEREEQEQTRRALMELEAKAVTERDEAVRAALEEEEAMTQEGLEALRQVRPSVPAAPALLWLRRL
jgi:hypothetical protein